MSQSDEITLREILLGVQNYWQELWRKKVWIILAGLLAGAFFAWRAIKVPVTYTAELTFMVNEDESGGLGGVSAILGTFGLGGGRRGQNLEKVMELTRSRRILQEALLDVAVVNGKNDYLANHIIDLYQLREKWAEKGSDELAQFSFRRDSAMQFDTTENKVLKTVYGRVKGNPQNDVEGLLTISYGEDTGILSMKIESEDEDLSIALVNVIYEKLSNFYIEKTIEKHQATFDNVASKTDSIYSELASIEYQYAQLDDRSTSVFLRKENLQRDRLSKRMQMLTLMYGEAVKNRETAAFLLDNATPYFQVVDRPIPPLQPVKPSWLLQLILGGTFGGMIAGIIVVIRKMMNDAMTEAR